MKKFQTLLVFVSAIAMSSLSAWAETPASPAAPAPTPTTGSLAKNTVSLAQDTAITTYIYAKLATQPNMANNNIDISTSQGKVTINGIVNNESEAKELTQLAQNTSGVKSVDASKIIIAQQNDTLYTEPKANLGSTEAKPDQEPAEATADPVVSSAETAPIEEQEPIKTLAANDSTPKSSTPKLTHPVKKKIQHHAKPKKKKAAKPKKHAKKSKSKSLKKQKSKAKKQLKKQLSHHHPKPAIVKTLTKTAKKQPTAAPKTTTASVHDMTNQYLKTAMMANKPVTEEPS